MVLIPFVLHPWVTFTVLMFMMSMIILMMITIITMIAVVATRMIILASRPLRLNAPYCPRGALPPFLNFSGVC